MTTSPQIFLAIPAYNDCVRGGFFRSLMRAMNELDCIGGVHFVEDSLVSRARNNLAAKFLATDFQWLLFLDADLTFTPNNVRAVYGFAVEHGPGVYAGAYQQKRIDGPLNFNALPHGSIIDAEGWARVAEAATGFMLIHRDVFATMRRVCPDIAYEGDVNDGAGETRHDFFSVGVRGRRFLSEDWYFCQRWHECGGDVWCNVRLGLGHVGSYVYSRGA